MRARFLLLLSFGICLPLGALDRNAFTFVNYDLRMTLDPPQQAMRVEGRITLRNDSATPQRSVALQISSSFDWESITVGGRRVVFVSQPYISDIDHTGELSQAVVNLRQAVPPGGTVEVEVAYGGQVPLESGRLERLKTPREQALRRDWDRIAPAFTGLRGVGHVVWYPVAMEGATLEQGDALSRTLAAWKRRHAGTSMKVALEVPSGKVVTNAHMERPESGGTVLHWEGFGAAVPTILIADYGAIEMAAATVWYLPAQENTARQYANALAELRPYLTATKPGRTHIADLPGDGAVPFEAGGLFATPLREVEKVSLQLTLAHPLMHAHFRSPRPWLHEGAAHLAQALEREHQAGRAAALEYMQRQLPALVAFEKEAGKSGAEALAASFEEPLYRTKAMYVLWMLRDLVGDEVLRSALSSYEPAKDTEPKNFQGVVEAAAQRDLEWFFADWVYGAGALPDLSIAALFPGKTPAGTYLVTLTLANSGAAVEVPVTLRSASGERTERVLARAREKTVVRIQMPEEPLEAWVNDGSVPESDFRNNTWPSESQGPK
jgi:hypothetical protein